MCSSEKAEEIIWSWSGCATGEEWTLVKVFYFTMPIKLLNDLIVGSARQCPMLVHNVLWDKLIAS